MKGFQREDDFQSRRKHLQGLNDQELKDLFWKRVEQIVDPLLELAYENTSPSIERSVLLRMGFSSIESDQLVHLAMERNLLNYGVGHVVYLVMKNYELPLRESGLALIEGRYWDEVEKLLKEDSHES